VVVPALHGDAGRASPEIESRRRGSEEAPGEGLLRQSRSGKGGDAYGETLAKSPLDQAIDPRDYPSPPAVLQQGIEIVESPPCCDAGRASPAVLQQALRIVPVAPALHGDAGRLPPAAGSKAPAPVRHIPILNTAFAVSLVLALAACSSPPRPLQPYGDRIPVNRAIANSQTDSADELTALKKENDSLKEQLASRKCEAAPETSDIDNQEKE